MEYIDFSKAKSTLAIQMGRGYNHDIECMDQSKCKMRPVNSKR